MPRPSPGDLPSPGIEPRSPALQTDSLPSEPPGKPINCKTLYIILSVRYFQCFFFQYLSTCHLISTASPNTLIFLHHLGYHLEYFTYSHTHTHTSAFLFIVCLSMPGGKPVIKGTFVQKCKQKSAWNLVALQVYTEWSITWNLHLERSGNF